MNVSITPDLEHFVQDLVASGRYHSASEVFREGLRLLEHAERQRLLEKWFIEGLTPEERAKLPGDLLDKTRAQLEAKIREGLSALDRGQVVDGKAFFDRWKARLSDSPSTTARESSRVKRKA